MTWTLKIRAEGMESAYVCCFATEAECDEYIQRMRKMLYPVELTECKEELSSEAVQ